MISTKMQDAINAQINFEFHSAYLYLSMSAYYQSINLVGFANWMYVQAQEEMFHGMKLYGFIIARAGRVILTPIAGTDTDWENPAAPFKAALAHEQKVTGLINNLVNMAIEERDHASNIFLQWFITEQVEEEANAEGVIRQLELVEQDKSGLFMIDRELGIRVYTPPTTA